MNNRFTIVLSAAVLIILIFSITSAIFPDTAAFGITDGFSAGDGDASFSGGKDPGMDDPDGKPTATPIPTATPTPRKPLVVIDPGHGGIDGGTYRGDILEKDINLSVCLKLKDLLSEEDITVSLTRNNDVFMEVEDRTRFANDIKADLLLSVHCDSYKSSAESGLTIYTKYKGRTYKELTDEMYAGIIHDRTKSLSEYGMKDRGIVSHIDYCMTTTGRMPSILIELGFLSNPGDAELLSSDDFQDIIAQTLATGIMKSIETAAQASEQASEQDSDGGDISR